MPFPSEHACRIFQPGKFKRFVRMEREHDGKKYSAIVGWWKDKEGSADQAYRYDKKTWTEETARNHCKEKKGTFEAALKGVQTQEFIFVYPIELEGVKYPADIEILREGSWKHSEAPDGVLEVTKEDLETFVTNFKKKLVGAQLPLDKEHKPEPTHALGWITNLWIKAKDGIDHLWAKLNITDEQTRKDLKSGCLRFISPTILIGWENPADQKNYNVIRSAALTNYPYIKNMAPAIVNFSEIKEEVKTEMEEKEIKKLKEDIEKREADLTQKQTDLEEEYAKKKEELEGKETELEEARVKFEAEQEEIKKAKTKLAEFDTLKADFDTMKKDFEDTKNIATTAQKVAEVANAEAKTLRKAKNEIEADVKIAELVEKGKVLPAQKDYLKKVLLAEEGTEIELTEGEGEKKTTRKVTKTEALLELLAAGPAKVEMGQRAEVGGATVETSDIETVNKIIQMTKKEWADLDPETRDATMLKLSELQNHLNAKKK